MMRGPFLLLVLPTLAVAETCLFLSAKKVDAYNGKKVSQSEMWAVNSLTKVECLLKCLQEKYCVSFHFSPSGPVCVALRERFEGSNVASTDALWYQLYQTNRPVAKVGSDCELDVDCASLPNSHCNDGVCRCEVGYGIYGDACRILTALAKVGSDCNLDVDCASLPNSHCNVDVCRCDVGYGIYGDACRNLTECSTFSKNFTLYKFTYINLNNIQLQENSSYESCPAFCISDTRCQSAEFDYRLRVCYLNTVTWFESDPSDRKTYNPGVDFFQRECLW
ncbi:uncharacterized protein LOC124273533 isoform X2 [Haliotis rubra]|uniref:uncharacterized protein LOC124273533 isoform X2 n=1 Tax=Haliotis rubra TaxID=36100 RepID=UPI001EE5426B|nr:uncharacterized protein LOC124273533 isoform X2 [Haliotis rubra]